MPADLGKDNSFFAKKSARYLCISKTESIADYVLEDLKIINEKDLPPEGYGLIPRTMDSGKFCKFAREFISPYVLEFMSRILFTFVDISSKQYLIQLPYFKIGLWYVDRLFGRFFLSLI